MTRIILALGLTLAASNAALANSSALDVQDSPSQASSMVDYAATASIGTVTLGNEFGASPRAQ